MSNTTSHPAHAPGAPAAIARHEGGALVFTIPLPAAPDAIRPIAVIATRWELELAGLRAFIARYHVPTTKIGRAICARESDLLGVLDRLHEPAASKASGDVAADLSALATRTRKAAR